MWEQNYVDCDDKYADCRDRCPKEETAGTENTDETEKNDETKE